MEPQLYCKLRLKAKWAHQNMKRRCRRKKNKDYYRYGGRGIDYDDCLETMKGFLVYVGLPPTLSHSLERFRVNDGYTPDNIAWVRKKRQDNNKRTSVFLELHGDRRTIAEWSERKHIPYHTLHKRTQILGWSPERALQEPVAPWERKSA